MQPQIFISYSQQPPEDAKFAADLAVRLTQAGFNTFFDEKIKLTSTPWPQLLLEELRKADFVIIVCSESYSKKFNYKTPKGTGKGVKWEASYIVQDLYNKECRTNRFIPVYFHTEDNKYIPDILSGFDHFDLSKTESYNKLLDHLSNKNMHGAMQPNSTQKTNTYNTGLMDSTSIKSLGTPSPSDYFMQIYIGLLQAEDVDFVNVESDGSTDLFPAMQKIKIDTVKAERISIVNVRKKGR